MNHTFLMLFILGPPIVLMVLGRQALHNYRLAHPGANLWPRALALMLGIVALTALTLVATVTYFGLPW